MVYRSSCLFCHILPFTFLWSFPCILTCLLLSLLYQLENRFFFFFKNRGKGLCPGCDGERREEGNQKGGGGEVRRNEFEMSLKQRVSFTANV